MKHALVLGMLIFALRTEILYAQVPPNGITITSGESSPGTQTTLSSTQSIEGSPYDTAIFDSTIKVPFKIYERRGEEMTHNWISLGAPRAPHIYLGAGIYRFDKFGLSDVQIGWYPLVYPRTWEFYFSASHMIFLRKKSKEVDLGLCIGHDYENGMLRHLNYVSKFRRDKFYGVTFGFAYEGMPNLKKETVYLYRDVQGQNGELHNVIIHEYKQLYVSAGLSRMRCKNAEYEAPRKRHGRLRASTMSRLTIGGSYYPVVNVDVQIDSGYVVEFLNRAKQPDFSFFVAWEGRAAVLNMKREWGFHMNLIVTYPTWNRLTDHPVSFVNTWGVYLSLDKRNPKWRQRLTT